MFRNYFKVAMRHLMRNKGITAINIAGLAIGMACCILIVLFIRDELSYNKFHDKGIYRLNCNIGETDGTMTYIGITQFGAAPNLKREVAAIKDAVRYYEVHNLIVSRNGESFTQDNTVYADAGFFQMFNFPLIAGDARTALKEPYSVVLSEKTAKKYFNNDNAIGKIIRVQDDFDVQVTGVAKELPANSDLQFDMLFSFSTFMQNSAKVKRDPESSWMGFTSNSTFITLAPGATPNGIIPQLKTFADKYVGPIAKNHGTKFSYILQPLENIHLYPNGDLTDEDEGVSKLYIYAIIGLFIILIACINFMNLVTARAHERAMEVGLRKVMGAERKALIMQFLVESVLVCVLSFFLSILLAAILMPGYNYITDKTMQLFTAENIILFGSMLLVALVVGLLAGSYPALYLSGFIPVRILKGGLKTGGQALFRKTLVVSQFTIAIALIIATIVIYSQLQYMEDKDLGYDKKGLVNLYLNNGKQAKFRTAYKDEINKLPFVKKAALTSMPLGGGGISNNPVGREGTRMDESILAIIVNADFGYFTHIGARFAMGRDFSEKFPSDSIDAFVINRAAARKLQLREPVIGSRIEWRGSSTPRKGQVIGVVEDFNMQNLRLPIEPMVSMIRPGQAGMLAVRLQPGDRQEQLAQMAAVWARMMPAFPFNYRFVETELSKEYMAEKRSGSLFGAYAGLAIIIACLGLFGLAMLVARQRTKEIGIRKVLGASVTNITTLLSRDFLVLVCIALLISAPLAWYGMNKWLAAFPFRIDFPWWSLAVAGLLALMIAFATISFQSVKAALLNPVRSLRSE